MSAFQLELLNYIISDVERPVSLLVAYSARLILRVVLQSTCLAEVVQASRPDRLRLTVCPVPAHTEQGCLKLQQ